jgi:F-type H+-transporting ATPase subunit epsilon
MNAKMTPDNLTEPASDAEGVAPMHVWVLLPEEILLEAEAVKIVAEAVEGSFALLPRHIDFVAPLVAGIVLITDEEGGEIVVGIDEGTLVKCGQEVMISTRRAMIGDDLAGLRARVDKEFRTLDEHEATARTALAQLEAGIIRRFIELEEKP